MPTRPPARRISPARAKPASSAFKSSVCKTIPSLFHRLPGPSPYATIPARAHSTEAGPAQGPNSRRAHLRAGKASGPDAGGRSRGSADNCTCGCARCGRRCPPGGARSLEIFSSCARCFCARRRLRKTPHGLVFILKLAALVLALNDRAGGQVRDADRGARLIDNAGRPRRSNGTCRSANPSGRFSSSTSSASGSTATVAVLVWMRPCVSVSGTRWTRVDAAFVAQPRPRPFPGNQEAYLLIAAELRFIRV